MNFDCTFNCGVFFVLLHFADAAVFLRSSLEFHRSRLLYPLVLTNYFYPESPSLVALHQFNLKASV